MFSLDFCHLYPFWRTDIGIQEDIVEEVGRLYGYSKLPQELPNRPIEPVAKNDLLEVKNRIRNILAAYGANEALTYSFVHSNLLKKVGQDEKLAYELTNALSPNLQYYRFNLLPSLLDKVHGNIKAGFDKFALFEIGKGHDQDHKDKEKLPQEFELLGLIYAASSKTNPQGAAYFQAKHFLDSLAGKIGIKLKYKAIDNLPNVPLAQAYETTRAAMVSSSDGKFLGIIGEFKSSVRQSLKLPEQSAGFEIDIQALTEAKPVTNTYQLLDRFPQSYQDLCLRSRADLSYADLTSFVDGQLSQASAKSGYISSVEPLDIYQRNGDDEHKQTTWRITLSHPSRTLTTDEVNTLLDQIAEQAKSKYQAERI